MGMVAPRQWIASAFVVVCGQHGAVTRQAQERGVSRQQLYRECHIVVAAVEGSAHRQQVQELEREVLALRNRVAELEERCLLTIFVGEDKQAEFASIAQAEGVSLPVTRRLLQALLGAAVPSVAQLGRWSKAAGTRARELLKVVDEYSRPLVKQAAADEIYVGDKPILMMIEQESLCWQSGRLAEHADGANWTQEFRTYPALEQVSCDAGNGMQKGLSTANVERQQAGQEKIERQLDHFHTLREGGRALRVTQMRAQRALTMAEEAQKEHARRERHGQSQGGHATHVAMRWRHAQEYLDDWSRKEQAWQKVQQALRLYTPVGKLNTRSRAQALLAQAVPVLKGKEWAKTKRLLARPETFTFLDRVHEKLAALPVATEVREAAVRSEGMHRHPEMLQGESSQALRGVALVVAVILAKAGAAGQITVESLQAVLRQTWRASSLVEGINSVVRMQQSRHRRMTQGLLDLKRLYWNCREFSSGKRKGQSPYQRLGVRLPMITWWELLKTPPEQLREKLSAPP
jgi:hypothetical protein